MYRPATSLHGQGVLLIAQLHGPSTPTPPPEVADSVWQLHAAGSHAELSTRHWFWGRRAFTVALRDGELTDLSKSSGRLVLMFDVVPKKGEAVRGSIRVEGLTRSGYARYAAVAEIDIDGLVTSAPLLLSDYGGVSEAHGVERRFGVLSVRLPRACLVSRQWSWPRLMMGPHVDLYAHVEWRVLRDDARTEQPDGSSKNDS